MNKSELVSAIAAESGLTKADSKKALDAAVAAVSKALKGGDKVLQRKLSQFQQRALLSLRLVQSWSCNNSASVKTL